MIGSSLQKKNIKKKVSLRSKTGLPVKPVKKTTKEPTNVKTRVKIDGFVIPRYRKVTICTKCVKTACVNKNHRRYLCTSAGYWYDIKKKYNWKIMGHLRLTMWVHKQDEKLKKILSNELESI
jgi:hypothetical protein